MTARLRNVLLLLVTLVCAAGIFGSRAEQAELTIRVAFLASQDDEDYIGAAAFRDSLARQLGKRVDVQIYPSGQFCGNERECIEALQSGILEVHQTTVGGLAGLYGAAQVLDLPYLFADDRIAECVMDGPVPRAMGEAILREGLGLKLMAVGNTGGWRSFAMVDRRIAHVADLQGLRIRTLPSALEQEMVRELGASPMALPFSEIYTALGAGMLAGTKNSIQDVMGMKFDDHIRHVFIDRHSYMAAIWWYSAKAWDRLPADVQAAVTVAFRDLAAATRRAAKEREAPALERFIAGGGTVDYATATQRAEFRAATAPLRDWYASKYPGDWLQRVDAAIAECEQGGTQ
ncbi:MAG: TRAP transporter substrate-binding protein DctP [Gammaproteobacteria bacterium]|nr:TRAP transporter substrate-binding protein DctP [Gammaproteobacteria bacterium]